MNANVNENVENIAKVEKKKAQKTTANNSNYSMNKFIE